MYDVILRRTDQNYFIIVYLLHYLCMQVIFIHSSDTDGRAFVGRFQTTSQNQGEDIEKKVQVC